MSTPSKTSTAVAWQARPQSAQRPAERIRHPNHVGPCTMRPNYPKPASLGCYMQRQRTPGRILIAAAATTLTREVLCGLADPTTRTQHATQAPQRGEGMPASNPFLAPPQLLQGSPAGAPGARTRAAPRPAAGGRQLRPPAARSHNDGPRVQHRLLDLLVRQHDRAV